LSGDGLDELLIASPGRALDTGEVYLLLGPATAASSLASADHAWPGPPVSRFGEALLCHDSDRDGYDDIFLGAPEATQGWGEVLMFDGSAYASASPVTLLGDDANMHLGSSLADGGNLIGAPRGLLVGAPDGNFVGLEDGAVFLGSVILAANRCIAKVESRLNCRAYAVASWMPRRAHKALGLKGPADL